MGQQSLQHLSSKPLEAMVAQLTDALKSEGFGVLTDIDLHNTFKQKLGTEFRPYRIIGACNPPLALEALQTDLQAGLMLPCNIIVYGNDAGQTVIQAVDPTQTIASAGQPGLAELAAKVRTKLERVIAHLSNR